MCLETIFRRRSIRQYTQQPVSDEILTDLLRAAMAAPSAGNQQPWHFVVIEERRMLDKLMAAHPHAQMLKSAPAAVLICGDESLEKQKGFWVQDCAAAAQNLLLAATARGLGSVWVGVYPREDRVDAFRKLLELPDWVVPFALIPVGHPAEVKEPSNRFNIERIHYERWGAPRRAA